MKIAAALATAAIVGGLILAAVLLRPGASAPTSTDQSALPVSRRAAVEDDRSRSLDTVACATADAVASARCDGAGRARGRCMALASLAQLPRAARVRLRARDDEQLARRSAGQGRLSGRGRLGGHR